MITCSDVSIVIRYYLLLPINHLCCVDIHTQVRYATHKQHKGLGQVINYVEILWSKSQSLVVYYLCLLVFLALPRAF